MYVMKGTTHECLDVRHSILETRKALFEPMLLYNICDVLSLRFHVGSCFTTDSIFLTTAEMTATHHSLNKFHF